MSVTRFQLSKLLPSLQAGELVLTPNHRISDAIHHAYDHRQLSAGKRSWVSPRVFAIDIWLMEFWGLLSSRGILSQSDHLLLSGPQELLIWSRIIQQHSSAAPLINLLETAKTARAANQLINQWASKSEIDAAFNTYTHSKDIAGFSRWNSDYEQYCHANKRLSLTDIVRRITEVITEGKLLDESAIVLVDFDNPPALYQKLFQQMQLLDNTRVEHVNSATKHPGITLRQKYPDQITEIQTCAKWAKQIIEQDSNAHIGVIHNNVVGIGDTMERIFADTLSPNSIFSAFTSPPAFNRATSGTSLGSTAYIHGALQLLSLNNYQQNTKDLCTLLRYGFLIGASEESEARIKLELVLRKKSELEINMPDFRWLLQQENRPHHCPLLGNALQKTQRLAAETANLNHAGFWAELFSSQLELLGWQKYATASPQLTEQLAQWQQVLEEFSHSSFIFGNTDLPSALNNLRHICNNTTLHRHFNTDTQISLYTPGEALGLHFNHVWIMGLDDQSLPEASKPNPFIPGSLQKQCSMPGSSAQLQELDAHRTIAAISAHTSDTLIFSYHEFDAENKLRPSQYVLPLDCAAPQYESAPNLSSLVHNQMDAAAITIIQDSPVVCLAQDEQPLGGSRLLSNQAQCPFRAFAIHRLGAETLPEIRFGLSPMARGNAIHLAMDALWKNIGSSQRLATMKPQTLTELTTKSAAIAIDFLTQNYPQTMTPAYTGLERQRLINLINLWLEEDKKRSTFQTIATEKKIKWTHKQLSLSLSVDRIDQLEDHSLILIDYKTGRKLTQSWLDDRPEDMQLPLYCIAVHDELNQQINGILFAQINIYNLAYIGVTPLDNLHPDIKSINQNEKISLQWPQLKQKWRDTVENLASEFCQGVAQVSPLSKNTCQYCDLQPLCRIQESTQMAINNNQEY